MDRRHLEFFPAERIELQVEVREHPKLIELLQNHPVDEFEIRLLEIATYCGYMLHGDYFPTDLTRLCGILTKELKKKLNTIIVLN